MQRARCKGAGERLRGRSGKFGTRFWGCRFEGDRMGLGDERMEAMNLE